MYRFGISMRITQSVGYNEPRDAIASDWNRFMLSAFPKSAFIYIPNIEESVVDYIRKLKVNVIILTGGEDIGVTPMRDKTELILLKYAIKSNIPIIAVCRGLQLIHNYFNGEIVLGSPDFKKKHKSASHLIEMDGMIKNVNSFHSNTLDEKTLSDKFEIFARCQSDRTIEGIRNENILAMMWHPERDIKISRWNKQLIEEFLNHER
jgi:N5-(cytidine 5'-diphosphoramidyl)-L-glutamine hydrolase